MTEPEAADLIRALSGYAWPITTVVVVIILRHAIARAIMRFVERVARGTVKTPGAQITFDFEKAREDARLSTDLIEQVRKLLPAPPSPSPGAAQAPPGTSSPKSSRLPKK